jgi:hypothetical protein
MFIDYQKLVLYTYKQQRDAGSLSLNLKDPTPAKLRKECLVVCSRRYQRKDELVLDAFFNQGADKELVLKAIEKSDIDKFRPLLNFIKESTETPEEKNVELLAWLIDFQPRPHNHLTNYEGLTYRGATNINATETEQEPEIPGVDRKNDGDNRLIGVGNSKAGIISRTSNLKTRNIIITGVLALSAALGTYWLWPAKTAQMLPPGTSACMYWTGEQYKTIPCSQKVSDTLVIAYDSARLDNFRRITLPDTITILSVGKVFYIKQKGNLEYFTSGGTHPVNPQIRLRPLTSYMYNKYILKTSQTK